MKIPLNNLKNEIETRLNAGGLSDLSTCQLQGALAAVNGPASVYRVPSLADLPNVVQSEGMMIYVDDINEYRFSNGLFWSDDVSSDYQAFELQIWSWGAGFCGKLGNGFNPSACGSPIQEVTSSTSWCQVSAGTYDTSAVKKDGTLWGWGENICGSIGDGTVASRCSPVQEISGSRSWHQTSVGFRHASAIKTEGTLWSWGCSDCGKLGDGTLIAKCSPIQEFTSSTNWRQVSAIQDSSLAIKTDGTLWGWGSQCCGMLANGQTFGFVQSPIQSCGLDWCQISTGYQHAAGTKTDGTLWSWGSGSLGQLGNNTLTSVATQPIRETSSSSDWCQVSVGYTHSVGLKNNGTVWAWGQGICGLLGDGRITAKCSPVQEISMSTNWCQVSANRNSSSAVKTDGTLWSWGREINGILANLEYGAGKCSPVQEISSSIDWYKVAVGVNHAAAIKVIAKKGFN